MTGFENPAFESEENAEAENQDLAVQEEPPANNSKGIVDLVLKMLASLCDGQNYQMQVIVSQFAELTVIGLSKLYCLLLKQLLVISSNFIFKI